MRQTAVVFVAVCIALATGLKCKCTQNSNRTPCENGICEVDDNGSCLSLDHPSSGRHYACSTSSLPDGECTVKTTKSGQRVTVCSCQADDNCNLRLWPAKPNEPDHSGEETEAGNGVSGRCWSTALAVALAVSFW